MEKEKQIDEMAELERLLRIRRMDIEKQGCDIWALIKKTESEEQSIADYLIGQGYRKASEVAREIFAEIDRLLILNERTLRDEDYALKVYSTLLHRDIEELKKKYTESEDTE